MNIVINPLDPKSIDRAIAMVKQYKKDFEVKEKEFIRRLAEVGVGVAAAGFSTADTNGPNDVSVRLEKTGSGYSVIAAGSTVGFIEFGVGKYVARGVENQPWGGDGLQYTPPPFGSYGKHQGLNEHGWWFTPSSGAASIHTYGDPPAEAMLTAREEIIANAIRIAREVWR